MTLRVHHIFVCTAVGGPEAKELLEAGLVEGSANTHPGQGTANRRFFFDTGFLELFWVHDQREARSPLSARTRLWDRWAGRGSAANPFGICFSSAEGAVSDLPFPTWAYRPDYLPGDRHFLFADELSLAEPEVFIPSWLQAQASSTSEPRRHPLGLLEMRSVSVGLQDPSSISGTLRAIRDAGLVEIHRSAKPELVIGFSSEEHVRQDFRALGITIVGHQRGA